MASVPPADPRRDEHRSATPEPREHEGPPQSARQRRKPWRDIGASTIVMLVAAAAIVVLVIVF